MNAIVNPNSFIKEQAGICVWFDDESQKTGAVYEVNNDSQTETVCQTRGAFPDVFYSGFKNIQEMIVVKKLLHKFYSGRGNDKEELTQMEQTALVNWLGKLKKTYPAREAKKVHMVQHANGVCQKIMEAFPPVPPEGVPQVPVPKSWLNKAYAMELRDKGIPCTSVEQFKEMARSILDGRTKFGKPIDVEAIIQDVIDRYCPDYIKKPDTVLELSTKQMLKLGELDDTMRSLMIDQIKNSDCPEF